MNVNKFTNKLFNILNKINNQESYLTTVGRTTNLSNELLETLKIIKYCTSCKGNLGKYNDKFHVSINEIENLLVRLEKEKEEQRKNNAIGELNDKLIKMDDELNKKVLCENCKGKKIENLTDKCENEEMARLLYESKLNNSYIRWIPFNEFRN